MQRLLASRRMVRVGSMLITVPCMWCVPGVRLSTRAIRHTHVCEWMRLQQRQLLQHQQQCTWLPSATLHIEPTTAPKSLASTSTPSWLMSLTWSPATKGRVTYCQAAKGWGTSCGEPRGSAPSHTPHSRHPTAGTARSRGGGRSAPATRRRSGFAAGPVWRGPAPLPRHQCWP